MGDIWKAVPGFEGLYEVSDHGRVWSLRKGLILSPNKTPNGYLIYHLYVSGVRFVRSAHDLVMTAFVGPRPEGEHVCHNDGDKENNVLPNLRYDTPTGNNADKIRHGTHRFGENAPLAKLTEADVRYIRAAKGVPQQDLADKYGCTFSNISAVQRRKSWRHV